MRLAASVALAAYFSLFPVGDALAEEPAAPGAGTTAPAGSPTPAEIELLRRVELLTQRVEELERRLRERDAPPAPGPAPALAMPLQPAPTRIPERQEEEREEGDAPAGPPSEVATVRGARLQFSGYAQFRITNIANSAGDAAPQDLLFQIARFRPSLVYQLSPHWEAKLDPDANTRSNEMTGFAARDAFAQWQNAGLQARLGQSAIVFGFENGIEGSEVRIEMERSRIVTTLFPSRRDIGLFFRTTSKNPNATWVALSVYNGTGPNRSDNNTMKNVAATVRAPFGHHTLGLSGTAGNFREGAVTTARNAAGIDHEYLHGRAFTKAELIGGRDRGASIWGGYVGGRYNAGRFGGPFARYDVFDPNLNAPNDMWRRMAMGWWDDISPMIRLTGEYDVITNELTGTKGTDTYAFQVQTRF